MIYNNEIIKIFQKWLKNGKWIFKNENKKYKGIWENVYLINEEIIYWNEGKLLEIYLKIKEMDIEKWSMKENKKKMVKW